ncbi:MAG: hypothetical protein A2Y62_10840 [Candidatus Fischerbacteria bacterium RBG_13_37_8]|uniref:Glycosyltransferase 2-like domain-containing protein n=1 Tax=Candidatus Fischerbacteria bacterium RBG_13_37_8 TaxID=1817863 RepID=A0A1F5VUA1_9BACT|nr:MAG: hypothetical protein A2Y62_10840 [Candidatus Fischerbacteria bacterium RBG_13_37_8]
MRAESLKKIGLLSEEYFFYHEESDWCFKAKKNNYEIWYVPSAEVFHVGGASTSLAQKSEMISDSNVILYRNTVGLFKGIIISFIMVLTELLSLIKPRDHTEYEEIQIMLIVQLKTLKKLIFSLFSSNRINYDRKKHNNHIK